MLMRGETPTPNIRGYAISEVREAPAYVCADQEMTDCLEIAIEKIFEGMHCDYEAYGSTHKRYNRRVLDRSLRTFLLTRYSPSLASIARSGRGYSNKTVSS